ncbi:hypothetical protein [Ruminococcus sp.]
MKHPLYSVSIDDIPFGDRIIAILLRTYLVRCKDAERKLAVVISEGIVLKLPTDAKDQESIPLKTVLEGEHLARLIDEAAAFVKADKTNCSDSDIDAIFTSTKDMIDNISGKSVLLNMSVELAEYITKLCYALKTDE